MMWTLNEKAKKLLLKRLENVAKKHGERNIELLRTVKIHPYRKDGTLREMIYGKNKVVISQSRR